MPGARTRPCCCTLPERLHGLRFIRSSSSSLPPRVMKELEAVFDAPVIEAYGMTEAAHQIASNPLPPGNRKPGSVGFATGCQVAILDKDGNPVPAGQIGEVAIRGKMSLRHIKTTLLPMPLRSLTVGAARATKAFSMRRVTYL